MAKKPGLRLRHSPTSALVGLGFAIGLSAGAAAAPPIRSSETNPVPACVTPERLMRFVAEHNPHLDPRYDNIAELYKRFGEAWHVRWDYAFFQMAIETNYLSYRRGNGRRGDVWESQNNFAGIGATGHGARGERFPDVETGVHAQIQHLVAYSGEHVEEPVARRTRENQDDIIAQSRRLSRPMTFGDLARRWATDRAYGKSIDFVADLYRTEFCAVPTAQTADDIVVPVPQPAHRVRFYPFRPPSGLGGPKPDWLAGPEPDDTPQSEPEVLPWLAKPASPTGEQKPAASKPAKAPTKQTAKQRSKVRTIWSRGDSKKPFDPGPPPPPIPGDTWTDAAILRHKTAAHSDPTVDPPTGDAPSDAPETEPQASQTSADQDPLPPLPTFHIAPVGVTPSRLGGPVPDLGAPATNATPPPDETHCHVLSASYGGTKTLLIRSKANGETRYTALTVLDGFEKSMFQNYANAEAAGAEIIGEYPSRDEALADAHTNCPEN